MASYWSRTAVKAIASSCVILSALLLPWTGQAVTDPRTVQSDTLTGDLLPTIPPPLPEEERASATPNIYLPIVESLTSHYSVVLLSDKPAFDKCNPPSIEQMQVWWDKSPYWSINIYMGGISLACDPYRLTPTWMHAVAQQGWTFIPTWVGLQAPCTKFKHRMSYDPAISYLQGRAEAGEAVTAARYLGLMGDQVIYADIESYSGASTACRAAVASFLQGWVDGLHAQKAKAGAYGAPCSSYIGADWTKMRTPPDYVWLAHWYRDYYDPFASVWNTPCLDNLEGVYWGNSQRIKQYTGPHIETWGGLSATLDSNALDGAVNAHAGGQAFPGLAAIQLKEAHLLTQNQGWALAGERLLWTDDAGESWREITPPAGSPGPILDALFLDTQRGWLVRHTSAGESGDELLVQSTLDGGSTWRSFPLQVAIEPGGSPLAQAFVEFVDAETGWLAVRLQSGSSFSLGRLFATRDGGRTWQERSLPLGEPVNFMDTNNGWTAGGPAGDQLFSTGDGGRTWQAQPPALPSGSPRDVYYGLPVFRSDGQIILPVTLGGREPKLVLYSANEAGEPWTLAQSIDLEGATDPGSPLPFSLGAEGSWWAAPPGVKGLYTAQKDGLGNAFQVIAGLPPGALTLDFASQHSGWAIVQDGECVGQKADTSGEAIQCSSQTRLLRTSNGGQNWEEITPEP